MRILPSSRLEVYGSYATSLHLRHSDIDLVISGVDRNALHTLENAFKNRRELCYEAKLISSAKFPVLKAKIKKGGILIDVDISYKEKKHRGTKSVEFVNRILGEYKYLKEIVIILKQLFYRCNFNEVFKGGIGSYALFLMTTHYLQRDSIYHTTLSEAFLGMLNYYIYEFDYLTEIRLRNIHDDLNPYTLPY